MPCGRPFHSPTIPPKLNWARSIEPHPFILGQRACLDTPFLSGGMLNKASDWKKERGWETENRNEMDNKGGFSPARPLLSPPWDATLQPTVYNLGHLVFFPVWLPCHVFEVFICSLRDPFSRTSMTSRESIRNSDGGERKMENNSISFRPWQSKNGEQTILVRRARTRVRKIDLKSEDEQRARRAADASDSVPVKFGARNKRPFPLPGEVFFVKTPSWCWCEWKNGKKERVTTERTLANKTFLWLSSKRKPNGVRIFTQQLCHIAHRPFFR